MGRDRVDRRFGHAALHRENGKAVPAVGALDRGQVFFAPVGVDGGAVIALDRQVFQRVADRGGQAVGPPFGDLDLPAFVGDGRQGLRQDHRRIGQQATPIARVMRPVAFVDDQIKRDPAARAHEHGRHIGLQARPVRGDQHIRRQLLAMFGKELWQARAAGLFAHLDHDAAVEPQLAARFQHGLKSGDIDQVLAFVVGGAAAIKLVAFLNQFERMQPLAPLVGLGADHVAVAIGQHGRQVIALAALAHQKGATARVGIVVKATGKAHCRQQRLHRLDQIAFEFGGLVGVLALGLIRDEVGKFGLECPLIEIGRDRFDRAVAGHASMSFVISSEMASPQGDMISVQPEFCPFARITPAGQAKA